MPIALTQAAVDDAVKPTIAKFIYEVKTLGYNATTIYREITGINDGNYYGRFTASGNPLIPFSLSATSIDAMIEQGANLRVELQTAIDALVKVTETGNVLTDLNPAISDVLTALKDAAADPLDAIALLYLMAGFRIPYNLVTGDDEYGLGLQYLALATAQTARVLSIYQLAQAVSTYIPNSQQDAFNLRKRVASLIDSEMTLATKGFKDNYYQGMSKVRIVVIEYLNNAAIILPPAEQYTFQSNLPAVVLAYRLYQDTTLEADIVARNIPADPGFMSLQIEALVPNS